MLSFTKRRTSASTNASFVRRGDANAGLAASSSTEILSSKQGVCPPLLARRCALRTARPFPCAAWRQTMDVFSYRADKMCRRTMKISVSLFLLLILAVFHHVQAFVPQLTTQRCDSSKLFYSSNEPETLLQKSKRAVATATLFAILSTSVFGTTMVAFAADSAPTKYDGFAEYAKDNQMEQSDVGCFVNKCGDQTKALFSNPRGIKGVSCLGRCKGEQACATRCFAEYGSEDLNNWLSCTIEENECVKVPRNVDNSAENAGYETAIKSFDPQTLIGTWYKTDGLNPNYDLFDCQKNTFEPSTKGDFSELDMGIFFRVNRPKMSGGGFWENALTEHMVVDAAVKDNIADNNLLKRTMHTSGKMYGLQFNENWYILGESDGTVDIPPFKLVAYKGHTLQGNYEGAFVYAKESVLPKAAVPAVRDAAAKAGLNFDDFTRIDNTCPVGDSLNDATAGTGTSTTDWVQLVVGEGGVVDWVFPGWRGEYKGKAS